MVEEAQLQLAPVIRIEMRPVLDAVHLKPLVLRGRAHKALEVSARVQALPAPIGGRQERHVDVGPDWGAVLVVLVVERMRPDLCSEIAPVSAQFLFRQDLWPADELAMDGAAPATLARAVLH